MNSDKLRNFRWKDTFLAHFNFDEDWAAMVK